MPASNPLPLRLHPEVESALVSGRAVVALESTVITHGLPAPTNLQAARRMEEMIREEGALPATIGLLEGTIHVGLSTPELEWLATEAPAVKVSRRDLGPALAAGASGGTTVAGTMIVAHAAGIRVFATGGIGGVHRGDRGDVSADLAELARTPVAVVCAGAKSILDLPRTLEWLETAGVPVIGWRTDEFPAFFSRGSGLAVSARGDSATEIARMLTRHWALGLAGSLVAVPVPGEEAVEPDRVESALVEAEQAARDQSIDGAALTPFLLMQLAKLTGGATTRANVALLENNARAAASLAQALR